MTLSRDWRKSTRSHTNGCLECRFVPGLEARWHKATASANASCVEVAYARAHDHAVVQVRDTKDARLGRRLARLVRRQQRTVLRFTPVQWELLLDDVAAGHFHWSRFAPLQFDRTERAAFLTGARAGEFDLPGIGQVDDDEHEDLFPVDDGTEAVP
jgi:Domain of unknown function (DUF397)